MAQAYDAVIVGAGHNGLTCACYLARAGLKTLVLDQYHTVGGMATTEEITLPGFRSDMHAFGFQLANLSPVPEELGLAEHGLELLRPEIQLLASLSRRDEIAACDERAAGIARCRKPSSSCGEPHGFDRVSRRIADLSLMRPTSISNARRPGSSSAAWACHVSMGPDDAGGGHMA